jgi:hypothetical protein
MAQHTIAVKTNSAGYVWVCSCGKAWAYSYANLDAVNAHTGTAKRRQSKTTSARPSRTRARTGTRR